MTPNITNVEQISSTSISVKWEVPDETSSLNLTRYFIELLFDGFKRPWPGK